ncbi:MAG: hypothetical protein JRF33_26840, partial [Deltaproteobacteria bacterium]|nr:hypothetical protein [Deltaproteobacteria bacterium]
MASSTDWLFLVEREGLVVSEPILQEHFPNGLNSLAKGQHYWFRREAERHRVAHRADKAEKRDLGAKRWINHLLEQVLEQPPEHWLKASAVPDDCRCFLQEFDQELKADRVLMHEGKPRLLVFTVPPDQGLDRKDKTPGRWKASPATRLERLMRETGHPLGLLTNGEFFRLLYAPSGLNGGQLTWSTRLLTEEKATLDAFLSLLGPDCLTPQNKDALNLADLCRLSQDRQVEVADQLGKQVRDGLERLLWAWDEADRGSEGALLADMDEASIYEMGLVTMMRLVFLLYAEERHLLPHGEVLYDKGYGLTWLWHRLLRQKREDAGRMEQSLDAWDRLMATCRLVHGGCRHPDLNLMAYGGSLFDPARFPVLENPAMRVSNKVMYEVLYRLLFAKQRKGGEPQRVGYWAVDVEQIGYVYEGLLDHRCAKAGDVPVIKLRGAGEAAMEVSELESKDTGELSGWIAKQTKRKKESILAALEAEEPTQADLNHLQRFPPAVVERVLPYAGV